MQGYTMCSDYGLRHTIVNIQTHLPTHTSTYTDNIRPAYMESLVSWAKLRQNAFNPFTADTVKALHFTILV